MPTDLTDDDRHKICDNAMEWLDTPYSPKAHVKGVGVDCGRLVYHSFDPVVGPFGPYPEYNEDFSMHCDFERYLEFIKPYSRRVKKPKFGDITLFHFGLVYAHAAILLPDGRYIHAFGKRRHGRVTISKERMMLAMNSQFGNGYVPQHYEAFHG